MKILIPLVAIFYTNVALCAPQLFRECRSEIVTEQFEFCPGEGGATTPCSSQITKWGDLTVHFQLDLSFKKTTMRAVYMPVNGAPMKTSTDCRMDPFWGWMECTTDRRDDVLGHFLITFHPDGIAPGIYNAQIFADATNVPVGAFQTAMDCDHSSDYQTD